MRLPQTFSPPFVPGQRVGRLLPIWFVLALSNCTGTPPSSSSTVPPGTTLPAVLPIVDTVHVIPTRLANFCTRLNWATCRIWEFTDDQRLNTGADSYGPYSFIVPAEDLVSRTGFIQPGGVLVAGVLVDTTGTQASLPQTYQKLNLNPGMNCVYLQQNAGPWTAFVTPETPTGPTPCPATH